MTQRRRVHTRVSAPSQGKVSVALEGELSARHVNAFDAVKVAAADVEDSVTGAYVHAIEQRSGDALLAGGMCSVLVAVPVELHVGALQ